MQRDRRQVLMQRCLNAADAHYLEDQWPDVGTGTAPFPNDRVLPAFTKHHWEMTQTRTMLVDTLAEEISANAWKHLRTLSTPLRLELEQLNELLDQFVVPFNAPALHQAKQLLDWVALRPTVSDGADCRINREVVDVAAMARTIQRMTKAVRCLSSALTGYANVHGAAPYFNAQNHPAYYQQWLAAVRHAEKAEWTAFGPQLNMLREERKKLLAQLSAPTSSNC